jgi:hypothetical protein
LFQIAKEIQMSTNPAVKSIPAAKKERVKRDPIPAVTRIKDAMKRSALQGKISVEELEFIADLATSLKVFVAK